MTHPRIRHVCFALALLLVSGAGARAQDGRRMTVPDSQLLPEGIAYDDRDSAFYVGSTFQRKIVRIGRDGTVRDFSTAPELLGVLGMKVDSERRRLWVASASWHTDMPMQRHEDVEEGISALHVFDVDNGKLLETWTLRGEQKHFLNDLDILADGTVLVTDTNTGSLYYVSLDSAKLTRIARFEGYPNGIALTPDKRTAFIALWGQTNGIAVFDVATRTTRILADSTTPTPHGIDGLYWYDDGLVAIQPFRQDGKIARLRLNGDRTAIVATTVIGGLHEAYDQPTTAAIAGDELWVIANSHLQTFLRSRREGTQAALRPVTILKIDLPEAECGDAERAGKCSRPPVGFRSSRPRRRFGSRR